MNAVSSWKKIGIATAVGTLCLAFALCATAQVQTQQTTTSGKSTKDVKVERGEVVLVDGNDLVVKMEDGTLRHLPNVPESARITVDGKSLGIHDLKPGMKLQRTITVTTTPKVITTTQKVTGKVWRVSPPNSVILTLEDGTNQSFKIPKDQKFVVNGKETDAWGLKKGMNVTATKVVEEPVNVAEHEYHVSGTMPPPPAAPAPDLPILVVMVVSAAAPAAEAAAAPAALPKTASDLPLVGLIGLLCIFSAAGVKLIRMAIG